MLEVLEAGRSARSIRKEAGKEQFGVSSRNREVVKITVAGSNAWSK